MPVTHYAFSILAPDDAMTDPLIELPWMNDVSYATGPPSCCCFPESFSLYSTPPKGLRRELTNVPGVLPPAYK